MNGRERRGRTATLVAAVAFMLVGLTVFAPAAGANHHRIKVSEVFPGSTEAGAVAEFVELQLWNAGQDRFATNQPVVRIYDSSGEVVVNYTLATNLGFDDNQRSVLLADAEAAEIFGVFPDFMMAEALDEIDPAGGAVCFTSAAFPNIDCVSWGAFTDPGLPSADGAPAAAISDGSSLQRSIAAGCSTLLQGTDDTNSSVANFANGTPNPRNNSTTPTEEECVLTVSLDGTGGGAVTGTGIDCPGDCTETYTNGPTVVLTATPDSGSEFTGWDNCPSPSENTCSAPMNVARTITANFSPTPVEADFDGDGFSDLAVGAPTDGVGTAPGAGVVNVIYGSASRLAPAGQQVWHQDSGGIREAAESGDSFGRALAAGDFDGDGYADLAIGVTQETNGASSVSAGAVNVIYGGPTGLAPAGNQIWSQDSGAIAEAADTNDAFGEALAAADLNGDGRDDLAVGAPNEQLAGGLDQAGAVNVIYGTTVGLAGAGSQLWHQDSGGIGETAETFDRFGSALAIGDLDGDTFDDLAAGVPREVIGSALDTGAANVIYGTASGLAPAGQQVWHQDSGGIGETAESFDNFGWALAIGDLDGDTLEDLAVGAPGETVGSATGAGAANVIYGTASGLAAAGQQVWHQDSGGIGETAENADRFGVALAAGDFDGDADDDLVAGVPGENVSATSDGGVANVIYGTASGLAPAGQQVWHQDSGGIGEVADNFDLFASGLGGGDFNGDGRDDAVFGAPGDSAGAVADAGVANLIYGSVNRLAPAGQQVWHQDSGGIGETAESGDEFGFAFGAGAAPGSGP